MELLTNISIAFPIFPAVPLFGSQELFKSKQCTIVGFEVKVGENSPFHGKMEEKLVGGNQEPHDILTAPILRKISFRKHAWGNEDLQISSHKTVCVL